jgi:hypothetical protein
LKVARSGGGRRSPFGTLSVVVVAFVVLILVSEVAAQALGSSILDYYQAGKAGPFDGIVAPCFRSWQNYINMDPGSEQALVVCPRGQTGDFASEPFTISNQTSAYSVPGVEFYPIYKTSAFVVLGSTANQSVPMNVFGLGYSQNVDNLLKAALVAGSLPESGAGYQVDVTDTLASAYGLQVGQSLSVAGEGLPIPPAPGYGLQNVSGRVVISGILSESALDSEFNLAGIPIFVQGTFGEAQTETALGYRIPTSDGVGGCVVGVTVPSSPCTVGPELFGIFSNNMMNSLFGFNVTGPDEVLFKFASEPTSPNNVLKVVSQIQTEFSGVPNVVAMSWRSPTALIGISSNILNPVAVSGIDLFDNASAVSQAGPVMGDFAPILALQASPVVDRLQSVVYSAQVLALDALVFCVVVEVTVFGIVRKKFMAELEIYKGAGLGRGQAFRELLKRHAVAPLEWGIGALALTAVAVLVGASPTIPAALVGAFFSLIVLELGYLTFTSFRVREVRQFGKERTG